MKHLTTVTKGKVKEPLFGVVYGVESVGKTTFGAQLPDVIFHGPEKSSKHDVARFPVPATWQEGMEQIKELINEKHDFKSVVIDSIDHLEYLLIQDCMRDQKQDSIEACFGSFGKHIGALTKFHLEFLTLLKTLREKRQMNILLLAHYQVKSFNDPLTQLPYDRYQMKMNHEKIAALYREAVDFVFFANFKTGSVGADKNAKKGRGVGGDTRIIYTEKRASHDAKNRFSLPYEMAFDFSSVMAKINESDVDQKANLIQDIKDIILDIKDETLRGQANATLEKFKDNIDGLKQVKNRLLAATEKA